MQALSHTVAGLPREEGVLSKEGGRLLEACCGGEAFEARGLLQVRARARVRVRARARVRVRNWS